MKSFCRGVIILLCSAFIVHPGYGQNVYMWTDKDGVVHMEDRPPSNSHNDSDLDELKFKETSPRKYQRPSEQESPGGNNSHDDQKEIEQQKNEAQNREIEERKSRLKNEIKHLEAQKNQYNRNKNTSKTSRRKGFWRNQIDAVDRLIKEKQYELEHL